MKLLTEAIKTAAHRQYAQGADITTQMIVAKFFDPCGSWSWYLMNLDPADNDYCWGIVKGCEVEIGSFSLSELQAHKGPFGLGIERDKFFEPLPAAEVWERLNGGQHI